MANQAILVLARQEFKGFGSLTSPTRTDMDGSQFLVLQACTCVAADEFGFVLDAELARYTQISVTDIRNYLESLEQSGFISLVRLKNPDGLKAHVEAKGRTELSKRRPFQEEPAPKYGQTSPIKVVRRLSWSPSHVRLTLGLSVLLIPTVIFWLGGSPFLRLRHLKRWGEVSVMQTACMPAFIGAAIGLLIPMRNRSRTTKAVILLVLLALACITQYVYDNLTDAPPTPQNSWYYGNLCFGALIVSNLSLGLLISVALAAVGWELNENESTLPIQTNKTSTKEGD